MTNYKNRCIYRTGTSGTGSLVLGELLDGTFFPLAEDDDGKAYNYVLTEGNTACEYGTGVYDHASGTLTREVEQSTNEDAPIELSGEGAVLAIGDVSAADLDTLTVLVDALTVVSGRVGVGVIPQSQLHVQASDPTKPAAIFQAAAGQSVPVLEVQDSAGNVGARITAAGEFSNSQTPLGEQFGAGATTSGIRGTAVGGSASAAHYGVAVGQNASNTGSYSVAVGAGASSTADGIAIGRAAQAGVRQFVAGSSNVFITNVFFGKGVSDAEPVGYTINGTSGSGTNVVGGDLYLAPGKSTGNATPASVVIRSTTAGSSGSTAQTLVDTLTVQGGNIIMTLPTSDPGVAGALWNDEGTLKISAG